MRVGGETVIAVQIFGVVWSLNRIGEGIIARTAGDDDSVFQNELSEPDYFTNLCRCPKNF
jgi:hypothetical protein